LSSYFKADDLTKIILRVINEKNPQSIKQLIEIVNYNHDYKEEEIVNSVLRLKTKGIIKFDNDIKSWSFFNYLTSSGSIWYWTIISASLLSTISVFIIPEDLYPWIFARNFLGILLVLFLPGYAFQRVFVKNDVNARSLLGRIDSIQRVAISVGLSIAFSSIIGLILYYSPVGLNLNIIVLSLLVFTLLFATIAIIREYQAIKSKTA